jgi:hypothetical protein
MISLLQPPRAGGSVMKATLPMPAAGTRRGSCRRLRTGPSVAPDLHLGLRAQRETFFRCSTSARGAGHLRVLDVDGVALSTEITRFSGLVSDLDGLLGSSTGTEVVTTGMVIRKMISSTSITSTSGVVLIAAMTRRLPRRELH